MVNQSCVDVCSNFRMHNLTEFPATLARILEELEDCGYSERERFGIRLALEEALVNAVKHGNRGDSSKTVFIRCETSEERFTIEIRDEGQGFRRGEVPDPLAPENLERPSGRGVMLMEHYMTWVQYNDAGNCVTMCLDRGHGY